LKIYNHIDDYKAIGPAVVTIGTFDGVHHGHQQILKKVSRLAQDRELTSVLLTFFPHPRMVLQPDHDLKLINTIEERQELVREMGIDHMIVHPFSKEFSRTTAHEYVEKILVEQLQAAVIVIGYDHRYGRNRTASIAELRKDAAQYDFEVVEISKEEIEQVAVSSTKVRNALDAGDVSTAAQYLNRPYSLQGKVVSGKKIGRTIGYPTANLKVTADYKLIPKDGVYITSSDINGTTIIGMTNIGTNPTVPGADGKRTIETYFLDYEGDLYEKEMRLDFHQRVRDERKFENMEQLKQEMSRDEQIARSYAR
jgi:riboflavin kinase/FMN adenylyltransferase